MELLLYLWRLCSLGRFAVYAGARRAVSHVRLEAVRQEYSALEPLSMSQFHRPLLSPRSTYSITRATIWMWSGEKKHWIICAGELPASAYLRSDRVTLWLLEHLRGSCSQHVQARYGCR